jgi:nucleoside-triphosphatase
LIARKNLFVTGRPGVGKTTLIEKVLAGLDVEAGGFYTSEIRAGGARVGFAITDLQGEEGVLAHVSIESAFHVGRYGVNREDLEKIGVRAIERAVGSSALVVMDEIGRMELCSESFQAAVMRALDSPTPVFGTIQDRTNAFLDAVRARSDVDVVRVTEKNRDDMCRVVSEKLTVLLESDGV